MVTHCYIATLLHCYISDGDIVERMYGYICQTLRGNANGPLLMARVGSNRFKNCDNLIKIVMILSK